MGYGRDGQNLPHDQFSKAAVARKVRDIRREPDVRRVVAPSQRLYLQGWALQVGGFVAAAAIGIVGPWSHPSRLATAAIVGLLVLSAYGTAIMLLAMHRRERSLRDIAYRQLQAPAEPARMP